MNEASYRSKINGLTSICRKVFDVVPINDSWPRAKIHGELSRVGTMIESRIIDGCLTTLKQTGVISETEPGEYRRLPMKEQKKSQPKEEAKASPPASPADKDSGSAAPAAKPTSAIDKIAALTDRARVMVRDLNLLIADMETAALEIEELFSARDKDLHRVQQLKALLNEIR